MKQCLLFLFLLSAFTNTAKAQSTRYIVRFKHKGATAYTFTNPSPYLSQRAIDRRNRYSIAIDSTDLPVPASFISGVTSIPNVTLLNSSRWLNAITIRTTDANALTAINALPYVQSTSGIAARPATNNKYDEETYTTDTAGQQKTQEVQGDYFDYGTTAYNEMHLHNAEFLHNIGLRGQTMQIAVLDAGFFKYNTYAAFDSANTNNQFLDTWDFVADETSVAEDASHGMSCLSAIAANIPGQFVGTAPKAFFRLFRTEDAATEHLIEEFNWACGAERADSSGSDVLSSSLGYNTFDDASLSHNYNDLNGDITIAAIAADIAARKGMLLFIAAGNSGNLAWHYTVTPADADSVIAVGAVNTAGVPGVFSSYGPSSDGRVKPDVAAVGVAAVVQSGSNTVVTSNGTSYACPKMAGMGSVLWQGFPEFNNMRIVRALKEAGSKYTNPDDRVGYGIPDMKAAFASLLKEFVTSSATATNCDATISWTSKDVEAMKYEIERKAPGETSFTKIGGINAQTGNMLANHTYQFINAITGLSAGTVSYRLRQIIDTSATGFTAVYIDTASFTLAAACTVTGINNPSSPTDLLQVLPNPVISSNATLVLQTANAIPGLFIRIIDMNGKPVMQWRQSKGAGRITIPLSLGKLAKGNYLLTISDGKKEIGTTGLLKL